MLNKIKNLGWFAARPLYWPHAAELMRRKFITDHDRPELRKRATNWAAEHAVSVREALKVLQIEGEPEGFPEDRIRDGLERVQKTNIKMGGPADLDLLYDSVRLLGARRVIETGVAYGWSSYAILAAQADITDKSLVSVDMPYPRRGGESSVGIVVPDELRGNWHIVREPDRNGIPKAISRIGGRIDLCHYDSDKSWWGRNYAFTKLWNALEIGGLFISDDIQDNMYFAEFVSAKKMPFAVTASGTKYVGAVRKMHE